MHHGTKIRGNHRNNIKHHPIGTGIGGYEIVDHPKPLDQFGPFLSLTCTDLLAELLGDLIELEILKQLLEGFGTNTDNRFILNF